MINLMDEYRALLDVITHAALFKLTLNRHKGDIRAISPDVAIASLHKEIDELEEAIASGDPEAVLLELGDITNFALVLAHQAYEAKRQKKALPGMASPDGRVGTELSDGPDRQVATVGRWKPRSRLLEDRWFHSNYEGERSGGDVSPTTVEQNQTVQICPTCKGRGELDIGPSPEDRTCPECKGSGTVVKDQF